MVVEVTLSALILLNAGFAVVLLAFARQLGLLLVRLGPDTALPVSAQGPNIGDSVASISGEDIFGQLFQIGPSLSSSKLTLCLMIAPGCKACENLRQSVRTLARAYSNVQFLVVSATTNTPNDYEWANAVAMSNVRYVCKPELHLSFFVSTTPYGLLLDGENRLVSKGVVNTLEQLESLVSVEVFKEAHVHQHAPHAAETAFLSDMKGVGT